LTGPGSPGCRAPCSRGRSRRRGGAWGMRLELQAGGGRGALDDYSTNVRRRRVIKTTAKTPNRSGGARGPVDELGVAPRYRALNYVEHSCQCDKKKDRFRARHRAHRSRRRARRSPTSSFVMLQPRAEIRHKGIAEITSRRIDLAKVTAHASEGSVARPDGARSAVLCC
jgi:hypothetical protein